MNGESQDDESDRDHAQEGQEPVGQSMKSLVTRGRQKEKKCGSKPYGPTVQWVRYASLCRTDTQIDIVTP